MTAYGVRLAIMCSVMNTSGGEQMKRKMIRRISAGVAVLGFFLVLGTAGASDLDMIPLSQILIQSAIGMVMLCLGAWIAGHLE